MQNSSPDSHQPQDSHPTKRIRSLRFSIVYFFLISALTAFFSLKYDLNYILIPTSGLCGFILGSILWHVNSFITFVSGRLTMSLGIIVSSFIVIFTYLIVYLILFSLLITFPVNSITQWIWESAENSQAYSMYVGNLGIIMAICHWLLQLFSPRRKNRQPGRDFPS